MSLLIDFAPPGDGYQRVALSGRLDTHTHAELDARLAEVLASPIRSLVLDLEELIYISSAGVRSIFRARKALEARGGKVVVVNPPPQIQKVFDVVKAVPLNEIFSTVEEADAYLEAIQQRVVSGEDPD